MSNLRETEARVLKAINNRLSFSKEHVLEVRKGIKRCKDASGEEDSYELIILLEQIPSFKYRGTYYIPDTHTQGSETNYKYPIYVLTKDLEAYAYHTHPEHGEKLVKIKERIFKELLKLTGLTDEEIEELYEDKSSLCSFEYLDLVEGYNQDLRLGSCMEGHGALFTPFREMAQFLQMCYKGKVTARCIVWNDGVVRDINGESLKGRYADRLYYNEGLHRDLLIDYLKKEGITPIWRDTNNGGFDFKEYTLNAPAALDEQLNNNDCMCWMDTFNHYNQEEGILYSYDWRDNGYAMQDLYISHDIPIVFLSTGGDYLQVGRNTVWSDYEGRFLEEDSAVYVERLEDYVSEDNEDFIYSYHYNATLPIDDCEMCADGYYYLVEDCIYSDYENQWYFREGDDWVETHDGDIVSADNEDFIYVEDKGEYYPTEMTVYSDYHCEAILEEEAIYSDELQGYFKVGDDLEAIKEELKAGA